MAHGQIDQVVPRKDLPQTIATLLAILTAQPTVSGTPALITPEPTAPNGHNGHSLELLTEASATHG